MPTPAPLVTEETRPFWEAAAAGRLLLPRCAAGGTTIWYPRPFCPACYSSDLDWIEASGRGVVDSHTVNRTGRAEHSAYRSVEPYVLAYVQLAEGPRLLTNIVECDSDVVRCGLAVRAVFQPVEDVALVRFAPEPRMQ